MAKTTKLADYLIKNNMQYIWEASYKHEHM